MDLIIAVTFCNCVIAMVICVATVWTIRIRSQIIGLTNFCDRCLDNWNLCMNVTPDAVTRIAANRRQFEQLKQVYQQQLVTLDRIRALQATFKIARSVLRF